VYAYPGKGDALAQIYAQTSRRALSDEEPGTVYYAICRDREDPLIFHFFEQYRDKAAFDTHNDQPIIESIFKDNLMKDCKAVFGKPLYGTPTPPAS